ncbi:MAG: hypothetical protein DI582_07300 [Azospirillum brasilense]|nr:MAG: hypothetical protein DI582_07300 [Azospirillum brasilense]
MPKYTYQSGSLIEEVDVIVNERGGARAYLRAAPDASADSLRSIQEELAGKGWFGIATTHEGKPVLEIRGFKGDGQLLNFLRDQHALDGGDAPTKTKADERSFKEKFTAATLKWTGLGYMAGDVAFMTYAGMELHKKNKDFANTKKLVAEAKQHGYSPEVIQDKTRHILHHKLRDLPALEKHIKEAESAVGGGHSKIISGLGYAAGSLILFNYGSRDQSATEIKTTTAKIERFLKRDGLLDPNSDDVLIKQPEPKHGLFGKVHELLKRYPSEALNVVYTVVGLTLMRASLKEIGGLKGSIGTLEQTIAKQKKEGITDLFDQNTLKSMKEAIFEERLDVGLGLVTATSAVAGIAIKEKTPIEGEEKKKGLGRVWQWVEEKPLRATGFGYMAATAIHAAVTAMKWRPKPDDTAGSLKHRRQVMTGRAVFIGLNVVAEALMAISSKGHGQGVSTDKSTADSVLSATAQFISQQDADKQDALVDRLAGYIASAEVLGGKSEEIAKQLRDELAALKQNPWLAKQTPAITAAAPQHEPEVQKVLEKRADTPGTKISTAQHMEMLQQPKELAMAAH